MLLSIRGFKFFFQQFNLFLENICSILSLLLFWNVLLHLKHFKVFFRLSLFMVFLFLWILNLISALLKFLRNVIYLLVLILDLLMLSITKDVFHWDPKRVHSWIKSGLLYLKLLLTLSRLYSLLHFMLFLIINLNLLHFHK